MEVIFCSAQKYFTGKAFDANVANVINIDIKGSQKLTPVWLDMMTAGSGV